MVAKLHKKSSQSLISCGDLKKIKGSPQSSLHRHSPGLQAIAYTLKHSFKELLLLVFLITISGFIFARFDTHYAHIEIVVAFSVVNRCSVFGQVGGLPAALGGGRVQ